MTVSLSQFFGLTGLLCVGVVGGLCFRSAETQLRSLPSGFSTWLGHLGGWQLVPGEWGSTRTPWKRFTSLHCVLSVTVSHRASSGSRAKEETSPLRGRSGREPAVPCNPPERRSRPVAVCPITVCVRRGQAGGGLPAHSYSEKSAIPRGFGVSVVTYKITRLLGSIIK